MMVSVVEYDTFFINIARLHLIKYILISVKDGLTCH